MSKHFFFALSIAVFLPWAAHAQVQKGAWSASFQASGSGYSPQSKAIVLDLSLSPRAFYHFSNHLAVGIGLPLQAEMRFQRRTGTSFPSSRIAIESEVRWYFRKEKKSQPYLLASGSLGTGQLDQAIISPGGTLESLRLAFTESAWRMGAGMAFWLSPSTGIDLSLGYLNPNLIRHNGPSYIVDPLSRVNMQAGLILLLKKSPRQ
jgi:hypothetical protein